MLLDEGKEKVKHGRREEQLRNLGKCANGKDGRELQETTGRCKHWM
jgi:hypothetical protein